jgi:hypothetical protein
VPAGELAAAGIKPSPGKTNRAIAAELGVSVDTVNRVRKSVERYRSTESGAADAATESGVAHATPEKRVGRDGKSYPATKPKRKPKVAELEDCYVDPVTGQAYDSPPEAVLQEQANEFNTELLDFVSSYSRRTLRWHQGNLLLSNEHRKTIVLKLQKCAEEIQRLAKAVDECCEP